jgi:N-acetylmuramoyl-L-alanine amidase
MKRQKNWSFQTYLGKIWGQMSVVVLMISLAIVTQQSAFGAEIQRPILELGSQGTVVSELQGMLRLLGYYNGAVDGYYGDNSVLAVIRFQQAAGLKSTGTVDSQTWNKLLPIPAKTTTNSPTNSAPSPNTSLPILREGMEGDGVKKLQQRLRALGYFKGVVDGVFGEQTLEAVKKAQAALGLEADGVVGIQTWQKLLK